MEFEVILREADENAAFQAVAVMQKGTVVDFSPKRAIEAARLSLQHTLPMADAFILASANAQGTTLWTQVAHFKEIAGVKYFPKR